MEKLLYEVAANSDVGQVRSNNEDALFCDAHRGLFLVCDGMGGQQAGEIASDLAVTTISSVVCGSPQRQPDEVDRFFSAPKPVEAHAHLCRSNLTDPASLSSDSQLMKHAIEVANARIHSASEAVEVQKGMGTTVAAVLFDAEMATIAHVGDSRVYLLRDKGLQRLTNDHSVGAEQLRAGVSLEEVSNHPYKHFLTRALGPQAEIEPEISEVCVHNGDAFLLVTDGLAGPVTDSQILNILESYPGIDEACVSLIEAAKHNGSSDNITCVLVKVQAVTEPEESLSGLVELWAD